MLSATPYHLMTRTHTPLNAKYTHPLPQDPQVSIHDSTNLKSRISTSNSGPSVDMAFQAQFLGYNSLSTSPLDLKTCEVKRHIICLMRTQHTPEAQAYRVISMDTIISKRRKKRHTQQLLVHSVSEIQWAHIASSWFRVQTHCHLFIYISVDRDFPPSGL